MSTWGIENMKKQTMKEIALALVGFALIALGTSARASPLGYLTWVGGWTVIATLLIHYYKIRKEAKKRGEEVVF